MKYRHKSFSLSDYITHHEIQTWKIKIELSDYLKLFLVCLQGYKFFIVVYTNFATLDMLWVILDIGVIGITIRNKKKQKILGKNNL